MASQLRLTEGPFQDKNKIGTFSANTFAGSSPGSPMAQMPQISRSSHGAVAMPTQSPAQAPGDRRAALQAAIARIERGGAAAARYGAVPLGLPAIDEALPGGGLAAGVVHEVTGSAAGGFVAMLAGRFTGPVLWCVMTHARAELYGPGLAAFGLDTRRLVIARCASRQDMLWAMEEGLRDPALAVVRGRAGPRGRADREPPPAARRRDGRRHRADIAARGGGRRAGAERGVQPLAGRFSAGAGRAGGRFRPAAVFRRPARGDTRAGGRFRPAAVFRRPARAGGRRALADRAAALPRRAAGSMVKGMDGGLARCDA